MAIAHAAGLSRIILVNSYIDSSKYKLFEFDFQKHTQINGANGSGKTSLLKLIPFFYGLEPGRITSSSNVKKSFSGYYLPFADSAIIFEYYNHSGSPVHVIISNAGSNPNSKTLSYRFVPYEFNSLDFIIVDEATGKYRTRNWTEYKTILRSKHPDFRLEAQVNSIDQYRSIIQNIPTNENHNLRQQYSLSSGRKELRYIDSITHSLITGHVNFENLKLLLTEILKRDHQNINLELKQTDITKWCNDVTAFRAIDAHADILNKIVIANQDVQHYLALLHQHAQYLGWYQADLEDELSTLSEEKKSKAAKLEAFNLHCLNKLTELKSNVTSAKDTNERQQQIVEDLERRQAEFMQHNAMLWATKIKQISFIEEAIGKDKEVLKSMTSAYTNVKAEFDNRKEKAKATFTAEKAALDQKISTLDKEKTTKLNDLYNHHTKALAENEKAYNSRINEIKIELTQNNGEKNQIAYKIAHLAPPEELGNQAKENASAINSIYSELHGKEQELRKFTNEKNKLEKQRQQQITECSQVKREYNKCLNRLASIAKLLDPDTNVLTGFLNEYIPDWSNTIGKLIKSDILERTDLSPKLIDTDTNEENRISIGKLSVNIEKLPNLQKDNSELIKEQASLNNTLQQLKKQENELTQSNNDLDSKISELGSNIAILNAAVNRDDELKTLREREEIITHKIKEAHSLKLAELTELQNASIRQEKKLHSLIQDLTKDFNNFKEDLTETYLTNKSDIETLYDNDIDALKAQKLIVENQFNSNLKNYNEIMQSRLRNEHIDEKLIETIDKRIAKNENEITEINNHRQLVEEYERWQNTNGNRLNDEREKLDQRKAEIQRCEQILTDYEKSSTTQRNILNKEISSYDKEISNKTENYKKVTNLITNTLESLNIISPSGEEKPELSVETLIKDCSDTAKRYRETRNDLNEKLDNIDQCMAKFISSSIYAIWDQAKDRSISDYQFAPNEKEEVMRMILRANAARVLIEKILPDQKRALIYNAHNITHMINEYYHHLREFDNRIKGFSSRISNIVTGNLQFEAFDQFNIHLEPCIKKLAGWEFIEDIANYYNRWDDEKATIGELPDQGFTDKMESLANKFTNGQLRNEISDLFSVVFEVTENGKQKKATTARELEDLSSNGLTFLLICALYISLIHESRNNQSIAIHWPVDEMSKLSNKNIHLLLNVMNANLITMVSAAPDLSTAVALQFNNIYRIAKDGVYVNKEAVNPIGAELDKILGV